MMKWTHGKTNRRCDRHLSPLLLSVACLLLLCMGTACRSSTGEETPAYDHIVTFDYNCGRLDANCPTQYLGVLDGALIGLCPGDSTDFGASEIADLYMSGWYTAQIGSDGQPLTDPDSGMVLTDRLWDFERDTVTADVTLYARWVRQTTLTFRDRDTGELLYTMREAPGTVREEPKAILDMELKPAEGYTLRGCYADEDLSELFSWPYTFTEEDSTVWVSYLEGKWSIVRTPAEFVKGLNTGANISVENDLDFSDGSVKWVVKDYNATIRGNGHTLSGIRLDKTGDRNSTRNFALFGTLREGAEIRDLTFADVSIRFAAKTPGQYAVGGLAWSLREGARLENVTLTGSLSYDIAKARTTTVSPWIADREDADPADFPGCDWSGFVLREET